MHPLDRGKKTRTLNGGMRKRKNLRKMKKCDCHGEEEIRQEYQDARRRAKRDPQ